MCYRKPGDVRKALESLRPLAAGYRMQVQERSTLEMGTDVIRCLWRFPVLAFMIAERTKDLDRKLQFFGT